MSESPAQKPVLKLTTTVEVESEVHGRLRFRKWMAKDSAGIRRLAREALEPREFAERLLSQQSLHPVLTPEDLKGWHDAELTDIGVKWWQGVEEGMTSRVAVDSLEALQAAVRQRNHEYSQRMNVLSREVGALNFRIPELDSMTRLTREMARQKSILDFTGQSTIQKVLQQAEFARPFTAMADKLQMSGFAAADRLAHASIQERVREARLLSIPAASEMSRLAAGVHPVLGYANEAHRLAQEMSARFRTFETALDSSRMRGVLESLDSSAYKRYLPDATKLESVVSLFRTSWVDRLTPDASIAGIARMTALTAAAHSRSPFDLSSVATLREALGDWRTVKMPWRLLPDSNLRENFYLEQGFDSKLIQLPEPAFSRALESVGLIRGPVVPVEADFEEVDEEELLRQRMRQVYDLLFRFERKLRAYIDRVMTEQYGPDWERHRCHGNGKIFDLWVMKREKAIESGYEAERLIHYADFTEYPDLITRTDNWDEVFNKVFGRKESIRESFHRLGPVRLCTMHARPITKTEVMLATAEITRLFIAIGESADDD